MRKKIWALALFMFWLGYEAKDNRIFPLTHFYKRHFVDQDELIKSTAQRVYNVYTEINSKTRVACPEPENTEVIVAIGQSNAANNGGHRFQNEDNQILNFFNGQCFIASDPMLGATDNRGSMWIPFSKSYKTDKTILLVSFAVGATQVSQWNDPQDLAKHFDDNMTHLKNAGFLPKLFIWIQGESDIGTEVSAYKSSLMQFMRGVQSRYPSSQIAISGTSYCGGHQSKNLVAAQRKVANKLDLIWLGSTDDLSAPQYRYDDCHFSQLGLKKAAAQLVKRLQ
ncbi:MAG: hypothetical protein ACI9FR_001946 [Cryomorphaceae bacterium]|jgi:hypothetical protein